MNHVCDIIETESTGTAVEEHPDDEKKESHDIRLLALNIFLGTKALDGTVSTTSSLLTHNVKLCLSSDDAVGSSGDSIGTIIPIAPPS